MKMYPYILRYEYNGYLCPMDKEVREALIQEQGDLRLELSGDMFADMELMDQIHNIQMKLDGTKPGGTYIDCIGCGS